ncbi:MAG: DUF2141 domain-containing protein [Fusobacteriota bacterium]
MKKILIFMFIISNIINANNNLGELKIQIEGVKSSKGEIVLTLFNSEEEFPKRESAYKKTTIKSKKGDISYTYKNIESGEYALTVYHDENLNGEFDMLFFMPKEGYGISNNIQPKFGPPKFKKASFEFNGSNKVYKIKMRY